MNRQLDAVKQFHGAFGIPRPKYPTLASARSTLRSKLVVEEALEFADAVESGDIYAVAKELADLLYVVYGSAIEFGIPIDEVFDEVHRSNMSKLGPNGEAEVRGDGKILRGKYYSPADVRSIISAGVLKGAVDGRS